MAKQFSPLFKESTVARHYWQKEEKCSEGKEHLRVRQQSTLQTTSVTLNGREIVKKE